MLYFKLIDYITPKVDIKVKQRYKMTRIEQKPQNKNKIICLFKQFHSFLEHSVGFITSNHWYNVFDVL